ncbi:hypothetical protein IC607_02090 [Cellulomonas sp. JH27-2]|uniref:hypothetical protein n=1 Tax=Cellulomonas sp. JH27-2 TaxID=2774139 RepID=UPI0017856832|nr:hypothetical protein [Cellulomonas sp. JH27-2]MBD8057759.1 hypothetical protein [Cellulomonas sp. JH27-2]
MSPLVARNVRDLRLDRRALRAEQARVGWWRRLVKARMDLAVAAAAQPQPLGEGIAFHLPLEVGLDVPRPSQLGEVLGGDSHVDRLTDLRALDAQLARYEAGVQEALRTATDRLIGSLATDPAATAAWLTQPLSRG